MTKDERIAELERRIKALELEVERLSAAPQYHYHFHPSPIVPAPTPAPYTPWIFPTTICSAGNTAGTTMITAIDAGLRPSFTGVNCSAAH